MKRKKKIKILPGKLCELLGIREVEAWDPAGRELLAGHVLCVVGVDLVVGVEVVQAIASVVSLTADVIAVLDIFVWNKKKMRK